MLIFGLSFGAWAQNNSLNLDFSDPAHANRFNFIVDSGGEVAKTVSDGEMHIDLNKKEWHFFQVWVKPFDFIRNPYLSFRLKTDKDTPLRIWVKGNGEKTLFNQVIPAGDEFQTIQLSFDDLSPLTGDIQEVGIDFGGYQLAPKVFSANIVMDFFRLGQAAKPATEVYGTSFTDDFSEELKTAWAPGDNYALSTEDEALRVDINRRSPVRDAQIDKLPSLSFGGKVLDISANPYINLDIKGDKPFVFSIIASDEQKTRKEYKIRVSATDKFQTISLDLSSLPGLNLKGIEKLYFDFNRDGYNFRSTAFIDNVKIGGPAANLAVMDAVKDKAYYKNTGYQKITLTHIQNASGIELTGVPDFVQNAAVSDISGGTATLSFTIKPEQTGKGNFSYTLNGADGYTSQDYSFALTVEGNLPPAIDEIANIEAAAREEVTIDLTGLSDGNTTAEQPLTFEVTTSDPKVMQGQVEYSGEGPFAKLILNSKKKGTATITVTVTDSGDGNNSTSVSFKANVYNKINHAPVVDAIPDMEVYQDAGPSSLTLTGINDGDKGNQELSISAKSSKPAIVKDVVVNYTSGSKATLNFVPVADTTGTSTISVTLKDNGGNGANEGNDSVTVSFNITVLKRPVTGYVAALDKSTEGYSANNKYYNITEVDSAGFKALVFEVTDKTYWDGVWMNLPEELDLSENPYVTMEVYPVEENTLHWIWLYDVNGVRNNLNNRSGDHIQRPVAGQWNKLVFDFSGEKDWVNKEMDQDINNRRITAILFDMHNADYKFPPPPNYTGTFVIRNLRIGSAADFEPVTVNTINPVGDQAAFLNTTEQTISLSGISNGTGNSSEVTVTIDNSNPAVVFNPVVTSPDSSGNATFIYNTGDVQGRSTITLTVSSPGSEDASISFNIDALPNDASEAAEITLDMNQKFQTMYGFGTFMNKRMYSEMYTEVMGGSAMRLGIIENILEPVNDNDDPNVLNMEALNYNAFDWDYFRDLKERGVENFILTSWAPPAWMKTNLSSDYKSPGFQLDSDATTNRLDYSMYEEFAESMVMTVKAFQQRAGIDLLAIGLQNEPVFHEPYASAILGAEHFKELIKVVGARFEKEGIDTRLFFAEHVVNDGDHFIGINMDFLNAVKNDPVADAYADIFAVHGYGNDGITPGQPTFRAWEYMWAGASTGNNPKDLWMTETYRPYNTWDDAFGIAGAIYGALEHGNVSLWTQWSFEGQMAKNGQPTPMLYAMSNYAKFIRPGAVRIASTETNDNVLATSFLDEATGQVSLVMLNKSDVAVSVKIKGAGIPESWKMYITAENRNLEERGTTSTDEVILLPPSSITTLSGSSPLSLSAIANQEVKTGTVNQPVYLTNLRNSQGGTDGLRISVKISDEAIVQNLAVSEVNPDGTASITFSASDFPGKSPVTVILSDESGNKVSQTFNIKVVDQYGKGLSDLDYSLKVFPNPSSGMFTIESDEEGNAIEVMDLMGRVIMKRNIRDGDKTVNASGLKAGIYILKLKTANGDKAARVVIQ